MADAPDIPRIPLRGLAEDERFRAIDRRESYYRGQQDAAKKFDWNGNFTAYGHPSSIGPGWYVPHGMRQPSSRYDLAKVIVNRLTTFTFGQDRFPDIRVEGDADAEDFARTLATESRLKVRMSEARKLGGACGTAVLSFGFIKGRPRVRVHNPKYITVLSWRDEEEFIPDRVLKAMSYPRVVFDEESKKMKVKDFWAVTFWDATQVIKWRGIPDEVARERDWQRFPSKIFTHGYGFTPVYWVQNRPCSAEADGEGDFEGCESTLDEINQLLSATTKGTKANVDPTLVIHADPTENSGQIKKGSQNAIFAKGGAAYLELKGTAVQAAERQIDRLRASVLDVTGVVLTDAEKLSGAAQSARALEILYAPMLANCDTLREQYGEHGIKPILRDMLKVARAFENAEPQKTENGELVQTKVILPPRMEKDEDGDGEERAVERKPGTSEQIVLNWRPYFPPTWQDIRNATGSMKEANGGKPTVSQRTSVQQIATLVGVEDVDTELENIHEEQEAAMELAKRAFEQQEAKSLFDDDLPDKADDKAEK